MAFERELQAKNIFSQLWMVATNLKNMENLENSGNFKNCQNLRETGKSDCL